MDDREFSSPVCYLNYDNEQPVTSEPALCARCKGVTAGFDSAYASRTYAADVKIFEATIDLTAISKPACFLCRRFFRNMADFPEEMAKLNSGASVTVEYFSRISSGDKFILVYFRGDRTPLCNLTILDGSSEVTLLNDKHLGKSTASDAAVNIALDWMQNCALKHSQCQVSSKFLPTRLVDVGSKSNPVLRLVLGEVLPTGSRYLTLSHCWGVQNPEQLLAKNFEVLEKEIDFHNLSNTSQDAVTLSRKLNCRYMWIDSLCIIQDNLADWHRESAQMGEVYRNSICNISASASKDGSGGLFRTRNPLMSSSEKLPLKIMGRGYSPRYTQPCSVWDTSAWFDNIERCSLNLRGWVCQERFLSPSNLYFGSDQLFWECKELTACEMFPKGFPPRLEKIDTTRIKGVVSDAIFSGSQNQESCVSARYKTWNTLLGSYTASKVTFVRDKLVAFSGLAAMWAESNRDEYFAGLWKSRLPRDLLWHTLYPRTDYEEREYVAPSWSWASMDGEVIFDEPAPTYFPQFKIISTKIELLSRNQFGQVKSGFLRLKGWLALGLYFAELEERFSFQTSLHSFENVSDDFEVFWDRPKGRRMYWGNLPDSHQSRVDLYLLPVYIQFHQPKLSQGLILRRAELNSLDFVRLGVFRAHYEVVEMLSKACTYFDTLPESRELDREEDLKGVEYTITLI